MTRQSRACSRQAPQSLEHSSPAKLQRIALTAAPLGKRRPVGGVPAGAGVVGLDFLAIHDQVSAVTTSVLYDRAGKGWSEDV
jgi:hypothetical protein